MFITVHFHGTNLIINYHGYSVKALDSVLLKERSFSSHPANNSNRLAPVKSVKRNTCSVQKTKYQPNNQP